MNARKIRKTVSKAQKMLSRGKFPVNDKKYLDDFYDSYRTLFRAYAKDFVDSKSEVERKTLMLGMVEVFSLAHLQIVLGDALPDDLDELVLDYDHHPDEYPGYKTREQQLVDESYAVLKQ